MTQQTDHPTMSLEQLEMIEMHTERAARKALHRYVRGALVGFVILVAGIALVRFLDAKDSSDSRKAIVRSGDAVAVEGCNRDFDTIGILRGQIRRSKITLRQYLIEGTLTQAQYERAIKETNNLLARYKQPDCRESLEVLTDDPESTEASVPKPKYPGHAKRKNSD